MRYFANGYLVTEDPVLIGDTLYYGVDTHPWPLGEKFQSDLANEVREASYADLSVPLLVDFSTAIQYCNQCKSCGISVRLLYCEILTGISDSITQDTQASASCSFLGYDYAYPSGDYYSAIANDVIYTKGSLASKWKRQVNEYGLMPSEEFVRIFAQDRNELMYGNSNQMLIECGHFAIFRVFQVN